MRLVINNFHKKALSMPRALINDGPLQKYSWAPKLRHA